MYSSRPGLSKQQKVDAVTRVGIATRHADLFYIKWIRLRHSSKLRGAECHLTFAQYVKLAVKAGVTDPDMIGKGTNKYQMGRKEDQGNYVWGNCRFITQAQNLRERTENGGLARGFAKRSKTVEGRTAANHSPTASMALKNSKSITLVSSKGKVYKASGLQNFVREHKLTTSQYVRLSKLCRGEIKTLHGWTGR